MRFTRFTEETTLYRSCYVLLTLYEPKLLSKYSAIKSFTLRNLSKNIYLKLSSSKNVFFNFDKHEGISLQVLLMRIYIHFGVLES